MREFLLHLECFLNVIVYNFIMLKTYNTVAYAVDLLSKGIGNRVVGLQHNEVVDYDIQEALKMKKEFPHDLYKIANEISF